MKFNKAFIMPVLLMCLVACSDDSDPVKATSSVSNESGVSKKVAKLTKAEAHSSHLSAFLSDDKVCDVIDVEALKSAFKISTELKVLSHSFSTNYTCKFTWDKVDLAAREMLMIDFSQKLPMRKKIPSNELSVTLSEARRTVENFVPRKLTPEQLESKINAAKAAAEKSLTTEQKAAAGDAANKMVENMMKKNNQNQLIEGVGDAAYWSKIGFGNLNVLSGDVSINISLMVADTEDEDIENAKIVFGLIQQ